MVCYGTMVNEVLEAADKLEARGISAQVLKLGMLRPNRFSLCLESLRKTGRLLVAEEVCQSGCIGSQIITTAVTEGIELKAVKLLNLGSGIVSHGKVSELLQENGLDAAAIADRAQELCGNGIKLQ